MSDTQQKREELAAEVQKAIAANEEKNPDVKFEAESEAPSTLSDTEKEAVEMGWNPEHQGKYKLSAEEYIRRAPLFEKIDKQSREMRELKELVKQSTSHLTSIRQDAYNKALQDFEAQKLKAVELGDSEAFKTVEFQTQHLRNQMQADPMVNPKVAQQEPLPEVADFGRRNASWYNNSTPENQKMVAAAQAVDNYYAQQARIDGKEINPAQHMRAIEMEIKKIFPHRFTSVPQTSASSVSRSTSRPSSGSSDLLSQMSPRQRQLGEQFQKGNPKYTLEMYAKDLNDMGRLGK